MNSLTDKLKEIVDNMSDEEWEKTLKELEPLHDVGPSAEEYCRFLENMRLYQFYEKNCQYCGTQRCMGVYDKDWREGCELFKKGFSHVSIDDSKESVMEETKMQNVLNIENKSYVMSVLEKMYDDWKEEESLNVKQGKGRRGADGMMSLDVKKLFNQLMYAL